METVETLLTMIVKGIVNHPDDVELFVSDDKDDKGDLTMINVRVHKSDIGVCIGEGGKTAEAIRKVVGLVGYKRTGCRVYVKIDAPKIPKTHFNYA